MCVVELLDDCRWIAKDMGIGNNGHFTKITKISSYILSYLGLVLTCIVQDLSKTDRYSIVFISSVLIIFANIFLLTDSNLFKRSPIVKTVKWPIVVKKAIYVANKIYIIVSIGLIIYLIIGPIGPSEKEIFRLTKLKGYTNGAKFCVVKCDTIDPICILTRRRKFIEFPDAIGASRIKVEKAQRVVIIGSAKCDADVHKGRIYLDLIKINGNSLSTGEDNYIDIECREETRFVKIFTDNNKPISGELIINIYPGDNCTELTQLRVVETELRRQRFYLRSSLQ